MNTKRLIPLTGMVVFLLLVSACGIIPDRGSGNLVSETRDVSGFDTVEFSGAGDVEIVQDGTESITIKTDDDVMPHVRTEVVGSTLQVYLDFSGILSILPTRLNVTLHVKDLTGITASGAWDAHSDSLETTDLNILISGAGTISIDALTATDVLADISGAGKMELAGEVTSQDVSLSGAGKYLAGDLKSKTATMDISGAGDATLWVTGSLTVSVSGTGHVEYYGQPQVSFTESGSGTIKSLGDK
jgi:Putative auto-transporter adhesin, head GIN domain